ncbi:MAG: hypothetical protein GC191_09800 [Azospirillum sp.]|nr:hypothetical protein [Azospirillum sp.]
MVALVAAVAMVNFVRNDSEAPGGVVDRTVEVFQRVGRVRLDSVLPGEAMQASRPASAGFLTPASALLDKAGRASITSSVLVLSPGG